MKKIFLISVLVIIFSNNNLFAHNEKSHQYIVIEALKLLEKQLSLDFSEMNLYRGNVGEGTSCGIYTWDQMGKITHGAYLEDIWDPIWDQNTRILGYPIFASSTHFWNPDKNSTYIFLNLPIFYPGSDCSWGRDFLLGYFLKKPHYTALLKAKLYAYGNWFLKRMENVEAYSENYVIYFFNQSLTNFYLNGGVNKEFHYFTLFGVTNGPIGDNYAVNWNATTRKKIAYNLLGRIAHLLADMSVPAHVHGTMHMPCAEDNYEEWMKYDAGNIQYWTADKVYEERGGFINPYCNEVHNFNTTIEYLMYTMAQIAQHYASRAVNGNDIFNPDIGEIKSILETYGDVGPTVKDECVYGNDITNLSGIRETTIPYLIRATAGLFYWFLVETGNFQSLYEKDHCSQLVKLNLSNQYINGDYYTFSCGLSDHHDDTQGKITTCPLENQFFTIGANARNVTFNAPKEIILKPGTSVLEGSDVLFKISQCNNCLDQEINPTYGKR